MSDRFFVQCPVCDNAWLKVRNTGDTKKYECMMCEYRWSEKIENGYEVENGNSVQRH